MVKAEYDVQQGENPKTSAQDVSYKSCLCALLIFIAICIIIILCGINWGGGGSKSQPLKETEDVEIIDKERLQYEDTTPKPWITKFPVTMLLTTTSTSKSPITGTKGPLTIITRTTTTIPETKGPSKTTMLKVPLTTTTIPIGTPSTTTTTNISTPSTETKNHLTTATIQMGTSSNATTTSSAGTTISLTTTTQIRTPATTATTTTTRATSSSETKIPLTTPQAEIPSNTTSTSSEEAKIPSKVTAEIGTPTSTAATTTTTTTLAETKMGTSTTTTAKSLAETTIFLSTIIQMVTPSNTTTTPSSETNNTSTTTSNPLTTETERSSIAITANSTTETKIPSTTTQLLTIPSNDTTTKSLRIEKTILELLASSTESADKEVFSESTIASKWYPNFSKLTTDENKDVTETAITLEFENVTTTSSPLSQTNPLQRKLKQITESQHVTFVTTAETEKLVNETITVGSTLVTFRTTTKRPADNKVVPVCHTSGCKSAASRMLSLMNHSVDACEDFYEFSCGGMQANNADSGARSYGVSRLLNDVNSKSPVFLHKFKTFYDSCVGHEEEFDYQKRINAVKSIIDTVGIFDTTESLSDVDVTKLFAKLVLFDSLPLMDVAVDLDKHSSKYILQLTLPRGEPPASGEIEPWSALSETQRRCLDEERRRIYEPNLNLTEIHVRYLKCNKNYTRYLNSLERTIAALGYYSKFDENTAATKIRAVRFTVDFDIIKFLIEGPNIAEISKAISDRDYTVRKIGDLESLYPLIQWREFFKLISGGKTFTNADLVQIYFVNHFHYLFKELQKLPKWKLNNALLAIFANDLFQNLVVPNHVHRRHDYCLQLTSKLFHDVTSYWYLKKLRDDDVATGEEKVKAIFEQMVSSLQTSLNSEDWLDEISKKSAVKKAQSLQVYFPDRRCKCLSDSALAHKYDHVQLTTGDYYQNLMAMKEFQKTSLYCLARQDFEKEYTFCYFIYPSDKNPLSFYSTSLIGVPFGLIETLPRNLPDYVASARIGFYLAREIGRHFDPVGIYYKMALSEHSHAIYNTSKDSTENMLSFATTRNNTSQMLTFNPNGFLSINQRMRENTALRLMSDSYKSLVGKNPKVLPWISTSYSKEETYFIAIAQEFCQKTDTLDYMLKLFESDSLPASLRVENMMSNSQSFTDAFKCREGATLNNVVDRVQFPYFPKFEYEDNYDINS